MKRSDANYLLHREEILQDLLKACKDFVAFDWENSNLHWPTIAMWIARFNQAIAKAEGGGRDDLDKA